MPIVVGLPCAASAVAMLSGWIRDGRLPAALPAVAVVHLSLWIVARGINLGLHTRMYFAEEAEANAADPVLGLIEQPGRRATLIAARAAGEPPVYRFDIRLQGDGETVFLDI